MACDFIDALLVADDCFAGPPLCLFELGSSSLLFRLFTIFFAAVCFVDFAAFADDAGGAEGCIVPAAANSVGWLWP
jgi:hypothetical protein